MKTYDQLTDAQKETALDNAIEILLTAIIEGSIRFSDEINQDDLQSRIDEAFKKAEKRQTPWFVHEFIMDTCSDDIRCMAQCDAEDSLYAEGEHVVYGVAYDRMERESINNSDESEVFD